MNNIEAAVSAVRARIVKRVEDLLTQATDTEADVRVAVYTAVAQEAAHEVAIAIGESLQDELRAKYVR